MGEKTVKKEAARPGYVTRRRRARSSVRLTRIKPWRCVELDRGRRAGPSPRGEQRRRCPPARRCSLAPAGQPPLKLTGAATSAAPGAATLSAHRRVSTPYPLSSVVSGAVLPPGHKSRSHCPLSALLRHAMRCGCCGDHVAGRRSKNPAKSMLWRCCGSMGRAVKRESRSIRPAAAPF